MPEGLPAVGGAGVEPSPGQGAEIEALAGGNEAGGLGQVVEKGQVGQAALAAQGFSGGRFEAEALGQQGQDVGRQPTALPGMNGRSGEGGQEDGEMPTEVGGMTGAGPQEGGGGKAGRLQERRQACEQVGGKDDVLAFAGFGLGWVEEDQAQVVEGGGGRGGGQPGLGVGLLGPGGADETKAGAKGGGRQAAIGGDQGGQGRARGRAKPGEGGLEVVRLEQMVVEGLHQAGFAVVGAHRQAMGGHQGQQMAPGGGLEEGEEGGGRHRTGRPGS